MGVFNIFALEFHNAQHKTRKLGSWLGTFRVTVANTLQEQLKEGKVCCGSQLMQSALDGKAWPWVLEADQGRRVQVLSSFSPFNSAQGPSPQEWCRPHSEWVFLESRDSLTAIPRGLFPW